jgi:adenylate cyclase
VEDLNPSMWNVPVKIDSKYMQLLGNPIMTIKKKLTLGIIVALAVTVLVLYGLLVQVFNRGFGAVEKIDAQQNVERVVRIFDANVKTLEDIVVSWSQWDESYLYLLGKNPAFIQKNVTPNTYQTIKATILCFVDAAGKMAYQGSYDASLQPLPIPQSLTTLLVSGSPLLQHIGPTDVRRGFLFLDGKPYLIAIAPVVNSNADSSIAGTMALLRAFNEEEVRHLSEVTKLKLAFSAAGSGASNDSIRFLSEDTLLVATTIPDIFGKARLNASIEIPRLVHRQGQTTIHYLLIGLVIMGIILVLLTMLLIHAIVVRRIRKLSLEVTERRDSLDFGTPVACSGKDEIGSLAHTINGMLSHVNTVLQKLSQ